MLAQISTLNQEGKPELVSQGFGIGIKQHNDMMLAFGYSRFVKTELTVPNGQALILRFDSGDIDQHHAEFRTVSSEEGSLRFKLYDATGNEGLFPASPTVLNSVNNKGPVVETPGVDVVGQFSTYAAAADPFAATLTPIENDPLWVSTGGFFGTTDAASFPELRGRHYDANKTWAVVIENISGAGTDISYKYQWHEY